MAKKSFGTLGKVGSTTFGEIYNIKAPKLGVDRVETTNHNQADRFRTFLSTLADWGEAEIECAMLAASITLAKTALFDDAASWVLTFEFGATDITMTFAGILTELDPCKEAPVDGKYVMNLKIKPTGDITFGGLP